MSVLPGVGGTLFPSRFLESLPRATTAGLEDGPFERQRTRFLAWWNRAEQSCGPATGLRAIFDVVAMPLAAMLGFHVRHAAFDKRRVAAELRTPGGETVRLLVTPWASSPSASWRDLPDTRSHRTSWSIVMAPPFVSVVATGGHELRRSLDFRLPGALDRRTFPVFVATCRAAAFDRTTPNCLAKLVVEASSFQDGVRRDLQAGVVQALAALLPALGAVPASRSDVAFTEALTIVYRILFLLFAESRDLVPVRHPIYRQAYSITSFCREAVASEASAIGLWDGLAAVTRLSRSGCDAADLIVKPFNGRLFARTAAPSLEGRPRAVRIPALMRENDRAISTALVALGTRQGRGGREEIAYADLGVEQLGAVYERVLDVEPHLLTTPTRQSSSGSGRIHSARRKETGTFYTPQPLAEFVVRRTLGPLVHDASPEAILALSVVDPAMGSGAFLVAACRFLSRAYERALVDHGRCAESDFDEEAHASIRRRVAAACLAGVDANPTAVQVARLSLWLTTLARGKPLSFLDHQLRVGDALVGASPDDLWRDRNHRRRQAASPLFDVAGLDADVAGLVTSFRQLRSGSTDTVQEIRAREREWAGLCGDRSPAARWREACDLWCAQWFWPPGRSLPAPAEFRGAIDTILERGRSLSFERLREWRDIARRVSSRHRFFHWPLEFPDVFYGTGGMQRPRGGFDAVIGNPPWEMLRGARQDSSNLSGFIRGSGLYDSCSHGHLNLYQPFVERALALARPGGRVGLVLPWGIATDDGAAALRQRLFARGHVDTIVGLDNADGLFPIHRGLRFAVVVARPGVAARDTRARFGIRLAAELDALPGTSEPGDIDHFPHRLNPGLLRDTGGPGLRIPDARRSDDLAWLNQVCRRFPPLGSEAGWRARFGRELNASEDRAFFRKEGLPVLEGKHIEPFVLRAAPIPWRITATAAERLLPDGRYQSARLAYRDVSGVGNRQALIAAILPPGVVTTHTLFCLRGAWTMPQQHFLCGLFNSSVMNRVVRLLMGGHVTTSLIELLPVPPWSGSSEQLEIADRAERLSGAPSDSAASVRMKRELNDLVVLMYADPGASLDLRRR